MLGKYLRTTESNIRGCDKRTFIYPLCGQIKFKTAGSVSARRQMQCINPYTGAGKHLSCLVNGMLAMPTKSTIFMRLHVLP